MLLPPSRIRARAGGRPRSARLLGALLTVALCAARPARPAVVLNEVLYDPAGADGGREFVELLNTGPESVDLEGYRVEFANGAEAPAAWSVRWRGGAGEALGPGSRYLIADVGWNGAQVPDALATLALQNGPDGVRLVGGTGEDRLGYGGEGAAFLAEGTPAPAVPTGRSLARRPDGRDTGDNGADWVPAAPSPGAENFPPRAGRIESWLGDPPSAPRAGLTVTLDLRLVNEGLEALPQGLAWLVARPAGEGTGLADTPPDSVAVWLEAVEPEGARDVRVAWAPAAEGQRLLELHVPGDDCGPALRLTAGRYQVGPAGAFLNEVVAAPSAGGAEWVEVGNAGPRAVPLASLQLRDADGPWRSLPEGFLEPGGFVVLAADAGRVVAWWRAAVAAGAPAPCGELLAGVTCVETAGAWPSLNNTAPSGRAFADRLILGDTAGTVLDHVLLGADGAPLPSGRSVERVRLRPLGDPARNWGVSPAPAGATPGCANALSVAGPPGGVTALAPNPFAPALGGALHVQFVVGPGHSGWDAIVFDLWGRRVRDLGGDALGEGARDVVWDGRDDRAATVSPGGYVVCVRRRAADGRVCGVERLLAVVVAEVRP